MQQSTGSPVRGAAVWWEIAAVLSIGVLPHAWDVVVGVWAPPAKLPYWLDSLDLTVRSACKTVAVLYLIARSGEPWERFGVTRPRWGDLGLGLIPLLAAECVWLVNARYFWIEGARGVDLFPVPRGAGDYALMVVKHAANGFAEELVVRAYLITRLQDLLRSRVPAVLISAGLFAAYHLYAGLPFFLYYLMFGVVYGVIYVVVRRVWPLALGHAGYNIRVELLAAG